MLPHLPAVTSLVFPLYVFSLLKINAFHEPFMLGVVSGLYTTWSHPDFWWPQFFPAAHGYFDRKITGWATPGIVASVTKPASAVRKATAAISFLFLFLSLS